VTLTKLPRNGLATAAIEKQPIMDLFARIANPELFEEGFVKTPRSNYGSATATSAKTVRIEPSRGAPMIQYVCETCSAVKEPEETWIVGVAAEAVGAVSARREINIQSAWNRTTAVHPFAVHFCSVQCKDDYMARLFAPEAPIEEVTVERARALPTEVVVERVVPETKRVVSKTRKTPIKRAA
jgi:hypothetical protein